MLSIPALLSDGFYSLLKFFGWVILRLGFGLRVTGTEHVPRDGAFLLASNHVSFMDPVVVGVACPRRVRFMASSELFRKPVLETIFSGTRTIPLSRQGPDLASVRLAVEALRQGHPLVIFPEGGRQFSGALGAAKRGVGLLAEQARVAIVPVLVSGTFQALPPDVRWPRRAKIRVAFAPPIPYTIGSVSRPPSDPQPAAHQGRRCPSEGPGEMEHSQPESITQGEGRARDRHERLAAAVTERWHRLERAHHDGD